MRCFIQIWGNNDGFNPITTTKIMIKNRKRQSSFSSDSAIMSRPAVGTKKIIIIIVAISICWTSLPVSIILTGIDALIVKNHVRRVHSKCNSRSMLRTTTTKHIPSLPIVPLFSLMTSSDNSMSVSFYNNLDDPLLISTLLQLQQQQNNDDDDEDHPFGRLGTSSSSTTTSVTVGRGTTIQQASYGLDIWRKCLIKGRLPDINQDFLPSIVAVGTSEGNNTDDGNNKNDRNMVVVVWPPEPLYTKIYDSMVHLQLPRFAIRHPETISLILRSLLRWTMSYSDRLDAASTIYDDDDDDDYDDDDFVLDYYFQHQLLDDDNNDDDDGGGDNLSVPTVPVLVDDAETIANDIANDVLKEWGNVVKGVNLLDKMFGYDHGLLQVTSNGRAGGDSSTISGGSLGFGIQDGIWGHSGWKTIPELQQQVANMPELKALIRDLGRRPSAERNERRRLEKFDPRQPKAGGAMGAEFDPQQRESVSGITTSSSLSEMLPSEAVLLRGSSSALRLLFLAKKVESKLLSYQLSGWADVPSVPRTRPLYKNRLPSAPGGPMIVCLDTSWSMSTGTRESLSKAVVLACVTAAYQQGRDCHVVAFSNERGVVDTQILSADVTGIQQLLDFLSFSFGGGTDVTGALKLAIKTLQGDGVGSSNYSADQSMDAADILLVTDGEIPDPPVPTDVMESLNRIRQNKGVQVHGLLVGRSESKPLERLCTQTHDFLTKYDFVPTTKSSSSSSSSSSTSSTTLSSLSRMGSTVQGTGFQRRALGSTSSALFAKSASFSVDEDETTQGGKSGISDQQVIETLQEVAMQFVLDKLWKVEELEKERSEDRNYRKSYQQLKIAIEQVQEGLVERGEDARLVVLAMISNEHILLLGKPGTGKSILGQRLAKLCDGRFFQRLLTRFTTPDELFGPLSLKSLENDEYRRCTEGFLPTADIAFLDEIFKANSAILNTLLTILNERKFDNAGGRESCPIRCVVGASNELPESDELMALFDRFLIRKEVTPVSDDGVLSLLSMSDAGLSSSRGSSSSVEPNFLNMAIKSFSKAADSVLIDMDGRVLMRDLRSYLRDEKNIEISDRRLVKAARLLKLSAASDGRTRVDPIDFLLLQHCFWNQPEERVAIREWLWENLTPMDGNDGAILQQIRFLLENVRQDAMVAVRKTTGDITGSRGARVEDLAVIGSLKTEAGRIAAILQERLNNLARHIELLRTCEDNLWIDPEDAIAMKQLLLPRADILFNEVKNLSRDAHALEVTLSASSPCQIADDARLPVIEELWESGIKIEKDFSEAELSISMKEAKAKYDLETFRRWKRAKKKNE